MKSRFLRRVALLTILQLVLIMSSLSLGAFAQGMTTPETQVEYEIRIENAADGQISIRGATAEAWDFLGTVKLPATAVNPKGYTASNWAQMGHVAASAVNAIHIKSNYSSKEARSSIFSILPEEFLRDSSRASNSGQSALYTDIPAGKAIFGGGLSPFVGSPVFLEGERDARTPLTAGYVPKLNDVLIIQVLRPKRYPKEIDFENQFKGRVTLKYLNGDELLIGEVLKPVYGVGRFEGGQFADLGRIRANHPGVIDISTSPLGKGGGFQIIPDEHGNSPEMTNAIVKTQWMVVGPPDVKDVSLKGTPPLFAYFIQPQYREENFQDQYWKDNLLDRFLVQVKLRGSDRWKPMPAYVLDLRRPLPKWADTALQDVTAIRILFPAGE